MRGFPAGTSGEAAPATAGVATVAASATGTLAVPAAGVFAGFRKNDSIERGALLAVAGDGVFFLTALPICDVEPGRLPTCASAIATTATHVAREREGVSTASSLEGLQPRSYFGQFRVSVMSGPPDAKLKLTF